MIRILLLLPSILAWLVVISPSTPATAAEERLVDGIAAQVGTDVVLVSEVKQMAAPIEERMRKAGVPQSELNALHADVLDRLVESRLIADVVRRLELSATEREVDSAIAGIARDTGLTLGQLEASVRGHGLTLEEYREKIRSEIERSKVLNSMVRSRVHVEEFEISAVYAERYASQPAGGEEVELRHILIAFGSQVFRDRETACVMAEEARIQIESGEATFGDVARELSDANPGQNGSLGWIHERDLAGWMEPVVEDLAEGQVSGVVDTRFGCNLLQVTGRREYQRVTLEQATPQIERLLFRQKMEEEYAKWVDDLRESTYIERKDIFRSEPSFED